MKCEIEDTDKFKNVILGYCNLMPELSLECDSDGIRGKGLTQDHTTFMNFDFKTSFFTEYSLDEPCTITVDTTELSKVLNRAKKDDTILLEDDDYNLKLEYHNDDTVKRFKIRQVDIEYTSPDLPSLEYTVNNASIPQALFNDWLKDLKLYDDKCSITFVGEHIKLTSDGEFGDTNIEYYLGSEVEYCKSSYSIEKIEYFMKLGKVSQTIEVSMGTDTPVYLKMMDILEEIKCEYLIAPRLEEED